MAKKFDPKAKAKRQKILAAVLGVVLLGVLAFQAPTILAAFGGGSSEATSEPTPAPTPVTPPAGAPAAGGAVVPVAATASAGGGLADSDPAPAAAEGQLVTFDRFDSKDPFVQQVDDKPAGSGGNGGTAAAGPGNKREDLEGLGDAPPAVVVPVQTRSRSAVTATISVNGVSQKVTKGGTFPENEAVFKLAALTRTTAKIAIVGGGYANGAQTITLTKGAKPLTLMNTADGTTYVLRLLRVD